MRADCVFTSAKVDLLCAQHGGDVFSRNLLFSQHPT